MKNRLQKILLLFGVVLLTVKTNDLSDNGKRDDHEVWKLLGDNSLVVVEDNGGDNEYGIAKRRYSEISDSTYSKETFVHGIEKRSKAEAVIGIGASLGSIISMGNPIVTAVGGLIGGIVCAFVCNEEKEDPSNRMPYFDTCPEDLGTINADKGETTAVVHWSLPVATDPEDGSLKATLIQGSPPGSTFDRRQHKIIYEASDRHGAKTYCSISFIVKVVTCDPIKWPENGYVKCHSKKEYISGTYCTVQCSEGYEMVPPSPNNKKKITCGVGKDNSDIPNCKVTTCPPHQKPKHGSFACSNYNNFGSSCVTTCGSGYKLSLPLFSICLKNKTWSIPLQNCKDIQPPQFSSCPNNIYAFADRGSNEAIVTWEEPIASDNSRTVNVKRINSLGPGSSFTTYNLTEIRYRATDKEGLSSECIFYVYVREIRCAPLVFKDRFVRINCKQGLTYGSVCELDCFANFPLVGMNKTTCERKSSYSPDGYWDLDKPEPYCKRNPCPPLSAPKNGAIACDKWMFGQVCQMQCSDKYGIPAGAIGNKNTERFTGTFICGWNTGKYKPSNIVPDCTANRKLDRTVRLGQFFYYTGNCNDSHVIAQIKENFIKEIVKLNMSEICPNQIECNVNNTDVTCGPKSGRKRRYAHRLNHVQKRSSYEIRVEVLITTTWFDFNSTSQESFSVLEDVQKSIWRKIESKGKAGLLTVNGLSPVDFAIGYSRAECKDGFLARQSSLTCVPCPPGTYLDGLDPIYLRCRDCPIGTFKEDEEDVKCTDCPVGTSTTHTGSTNSSFCLAKCDIGEFSNTGLYPCYPCPQASFQSGTGERSCDKCPFEKTTKYHKSTSQENCSYFDLLLTSVGDSIEYVNSGMDERELTLMLWIRVPRVKANLTLLKTAFASSKLQIDYSNQVYIKLNRKTHSTEVQLATDTWTHLVIQMGTSNLKSKIFVNGKERFSSTAIIKPHSAPYLVGKQQKISITLNEKSLAGFSISGYQLHFRLLTDPEITEISNKCHKTILNATISMESVKNATIIGAGQVVPSQCDDVDQCDTNPCNGHPCEDRINAFICVCENGYRGERCEHAPDFCVHKPCQHGGTCRNTRHNFTCTCPTGYKGSTCETKIVDGGWSSWCLFSDCSSSCGGGMHSRSRVCNSPAPSPDGKPCDQTESYETVACNTQPCPTCPHLKRAFANEINCTYTDGHHLCVISCRRGYTFVSGNLPLPVYRCGPNTSYSWNGMPPSCGRANSPERISLISHIKYDTEIPCSQATAASQQLKKNVELHLICILNNTCSMNIEMPECAVSNRHRRSSSSYTQTITLSQQFQGGDNLGLNNSQTASEPLIDLVKGVKNLEASAVQINNSYDILQFQLNGLSFTSTAIQITSALQCQSGQGRSAVFCVDCPLGTYSSSGKCRLCDLGTYQNETGKDACKRCPSGYTTDYIGSQERNDCKEIIKPILSSEPLTSGRMNSVTQRNKHMHQKDDDNPATIIGSVCGVVAVVIVGIVVLVIFKYKKTTSNRNISVEVDDTFSADVGFQKESKKTFDAGDLTEQ